MNQKIKLLHDMIRVQILQLWFLLYQRVIAIQVSCVTSCVWVQVTAAHRATYTTSRYTA